MFLTTVFLSRWRSFWGGHCFSDFGPSFRWSTSHLSVWDWYHRIRHEILLHFDLYLDPCCKLSHRSSPVLLFFEDEHFIFWPFSEFPISLLEYWASSVLNMGPACQIWIFIDLILYIWRKTNCSKVKRNAKFRRVHKNGFRIRDRCLWTRDGASPWKPQGDVKGWRIFKKGTMALRNYQRLWRDSGRSGRLVNQTPQSTKKRTIFAKRGNLHTFKLETQKWEQKTKMFKMKSTIMFIHKMKYKYRGHPETVALMQNAKVKSWKPGKRSIPLRRVEPRGGPKNDSCQTTQTWHA